VSTRTAGNPGPAAAAAAKASANPLQTYLAAFERLKAGARGCGRNWLCDLRKEGFARFAELGFPTTRDEEWKYTDVSPVARLAFQPVLEPALDGVTESVLRPFLLEGAAARLVFVNGWFAPALSAVDDLPAGVVAGSLAAALAGEPEDVASYLGRFAPHRAHPFAALNTAFLTDGALVRVPRGAVVAQPIHLLFVSTAPAAAVAPRLASPRNLLLAGTGSQLAVVESYVGLGRDVYLTNAVTEILAEDGAVVDHVKIQDESDKAFHFATVQVQQGRASQFVSHSISLGGALTRNDLNAVFTEEGGECTLNGLYMAGGRQLVDNHTFIDHARPNCTSHQLYKGVLDGKARAVFNGKIVVRPDAQKTNARQTNRNLVLSDDTVVNSKPQLEIFANDVKCAHGATVGQVDKDTLFYLRSRGLTQAAARNLLTYAFAGEVLEDIRVRPTREHIAGLLARRLPGGPGAGEAMPS
jgi:Fe-S cluster assembly protein SufD